MKSRLVRIVDLSAQEVESMYLLLCSHFQGVRRDVFNTDLNGKNWVILLESESTNQLQGFSTLFMYNTSFQGENLSVVYSGDTIVDPSAWSSSTLSKSWLDAVNKLRSQYCQGKLYWLLISAGYRTYRFLPVFWQDFYPRYDAPTPAPVALLMHFLAQERFGECYNPRGGIVRFPHPHILHDRLKGIPQERLQDPHINFFAQVNPGHINGDELVCLAEISEQNLTCAGRRINSKIQNRKNQAPAMVCAIAIE